MESQAIEPVKNLFEQEAVKKRFQELLGEKAQSFIVSVINAVSSSEALKDAERNSILFAAATAASLDLPIDPNLGFAYIIPYKGKDGVQKAQFQMGYKGFIQLAQRSGQFRTISVTRICEGELVEENPLLGYRFDFGKRTSDKVIGYAAYIELLNGFQKTSYMTVAELKEHGVKYSKTYRKNFGLWVDDFEAMAEKTVVKLLLSKWAPLSIEMRKAIVTDQSVAKDWEGMMLEYPDNGKEIVLLEDLIQLYGIKKKECSDEERENAERIIDTKEERSYGKLKSILSSK